MFSRLPVTSNRTRKDSLQGSGVLKDILHEASMVGGKVMTLESTSAGAQQLVAKMDRRIKDDDILGLHLMRDGQCKSGGTGSEKVTNAGSLDKLQGMALKRSVWSLKTAASMITKGGQNISAADCFELDSDTRLQLTFQHGIQFCEGKLKKFYEERVERNYKKRGKSGAEEEILSTPTAKGDDEKSGESQIEASDDDEVLTDKEKKLIDTLSEEIRWLTAVYNGLCGGSVMDDALIAKINGYTTWEVIKEHNWAAETYVLTVLTTCCENTNVTGKINAALKNQLNAGEGTVAYQLGLKSDVAHILSVINTQLMSVTSENYISLCTRINNFRLNPWNLKNKEFGAQLDEYKDLREEASLMLRSLEEGHDAGRFDGIGSHMPNLYWGIRGLFSHEQLGSKSRDSLNYQLIELHVRDMNNKIATMNVGTEMDRFLEVESMARAIDDVIAYVPESKRRGGAEDVTLFAGNADKNRGTSTKWCIGHLRWGSCKSKKCKFHVFTPAEYANRVECEKDKTGNCDLGNKCPRRHKGDPKELTKELMDKCFHFRGKANVVQEVVEGDLVVAQDKSGLN